ncbi:MAG: hypothetical protein ACK4ND_09340 [Cytophagaceae bacterium]
MLNRIIAILLLFVILAQALSKVGLVAYYNINKEYIAETLCENKAKPELDCEGKCYLKKQLEEDEKHQSESKNTTEKSTFNIFINECDPFASIITFTENTYPEFTATYTHSVANIIFHPPLV